MHTVRMVLAFVLVSFLSLLTFGQEGKLSDQTQRLLDGIRMPTPRDSLSAEHLARLKALVRRTHTLDDDTRFGERFTDETAREAASLAREWKDLYRDATGEEADPSDLSVPLEARLSIDPKDQFSIAQHVFWKMTKAYPTFFDGVEVLEEPPASLQRQETLQAEQDVIDAERKLRDNDQVREMTRQHLLDAERRLRESEQTRAGRDDRRTPGAIARLSIKVLMLLYVIYCLANASASSLSKTTAAFGAGLVLSMLVLEFIYFV